MRNLLDIVNLRQSFFVFDIFRIVLYFSLCAILIIVGIYGQSLIYAMFGSGNIYIYEKGNFAVHFLDVGHGDCTIFQFPDGKIAIIDGGQDTEQYSYYKRIKNYIDTRIKPRKNKIDYVINTHPHDDHLGGLLRVIQDYKIGIFLNYENIFEGQILGGDSYRVQFHAVDCANASDENEASPIITVEYANKVFLVTGDAGFETETAFCQAETARAIFGNDGENANFLDVYLRVGHHGSKNSTGTPFLNFIKPDIAIISSGTASQILYNHPNPETINRLENVNAQIYITREEGNIAIRCVNNGVKMFFGFDNSPDLSWIWMVLFFVLTLLCFVNQNSIKKVEKIYRL